MQIADKRQGRTIGIRKRNFCDGFSLQARKPNRAAAETADRSKEGEAMKFPGLSGDSLPDGKRGAWLVQSVCGGYVFLMSSDLKRTLRLSVSKFNWYWDEIQKARSEAKP